METTVNLNTLTVRNPMTMSLSELRAEKRARLQQGLEAFDNLHAVVTTFGSPVEISHRQYTVFQRGTLTAVYRLEIGNYIPAEHRYQETEVLSVFLDPRGIVGVKNGGGVKVCHLTRGDRERIEEHVFNPGDWLYGNEAKEISGLLSDLPNAREIEKQTGIVARENERLALLAELMIGQEI